MLDEKSQDLNKKRLYMQAKRADPVYREKQRLYQQELRNDPIRKEVARLKREEKRRASNILTREEKQEKHFRDFLKNAELVHKGKYEYTRVQYQNRYTHVEIICKIHGVFKQSPNGHLNGQGCPDCANIQRSLFYRSKGEVLIEQFLVAHNIKYETQKMFANCKHVFALKYDFYLPDMNLLIEFDGLQHYQFVKRFHKVEENFLQTQLRDKIKTNFAKDNNIALHRITYKEQNQIEQILANLLI